MIGVCMKYAQHNYGGMLQAQALCYELDRRNIQYELIRYEKHDSILKKIKFIPRFFNIVLINDKMLEMKKKKAFIFHPEFKANNQKRIDAFDRYSNEKFKKLSEIYVGYESLCKASKKYDAVMVGSDQLWSPSGLPTNFFNLKFVPDKIRKISVASSFGVKQIPTYQKSRTADYLKRIDFISMRENRGKEIVKELTGRDVPVITDPVFLLNREEWEEVVPPKKIYEESYVFAYFLGPNEEHRKAVEEFAKKKGLKTVAFRHVDQYVKSDEKFGDITPYDVTPDRFLNILRNAEYVFTDSFHGAVFSAIHKKDFVIFDRYRDGASFSKNSRIDSFCDNLNLGYRRYRGDLEKNLEKTIDYDEVQRNIERMLAETKKYLDAALSDVN